MGHNDLSPSPSLQVGSVLVTGNFGRAAPRGYPAPTNHHHNRYNTRQRPIEERGGKRGNSAIVTIDPDHLTQVQRDAGRLFMEGQGWGFGGSVDVAAIEPWNVPGRYGWLGGTGTVAYIIPSTGAVTILLTQVGMTGPTPTPLMRDFWRYAANA